eukprot:gene8263-biopygen6117
MKVLKTFMGHAIKTRPPVVAAEHARGGLGSCATLTDQVCTVPLATRTPATRSGRRIATRPEVSLCAHRCHAGFRIPLDPIQTYLAATVSAGAGGYVSPDKVAAEGCPLRRTFIVQ